jgi:hypothetical protein
VGQGDIHEWPGLARAKGLRQWPSVDDLARRVADLPPIAGVLLLGSFARGEADALSDVDFIVVVYEGRFEEAWERRHELHAEDAACWDYPRPPEREVAGHRWLTSDFVLFDGLLGTPSGTRVADPFVVFVGDETLPDQLTRRGPITDTEKEARRDELELHEIEQLYGELKLAFRKALTR